MPASQPDSASGPAHADGPAHPDGPAHAGGPAPTGGTAPAGESVSADVLELERALTRIAYLITRTRRHDRIRAVAEVPLDRAAVVILRQLADSGGMRLGELAARLAVEAPHITRQVQRLQQAGYVDRVPDPDDRRAQVVTLTAAGKAADDRLREVARGAMQAALADWAPQDVHKLATLFHRMVDDFIAYDAAEETE